MSAPKTEQELIDAEIREREDAELEDLYNEPEWTDDGNAYAQE